MGRQRSPTRMVCRFCRPESPSSYRVSVQLQSQCKIVRLPLLFSTSALQTFHGVLCVYMKGRPGYQLVDDDVFWLLDSDGDHFNINTHTSYTHAVLYPGVWESPVKPGAILYMTYQYLTDPSSVCCREHGCTRHPFKWGQASSLVQQFCFCALLKPPHTAVTCGWEPTGSVVKIST